MNFDNKIKGLENAVSGFLSRIIATFAHLQH